MKITAGCADTPRRFLPHLSGSELRIKKALYEARLGRFLCRVGSAPEGFEQRVTQRLADREAFDSLRAPFRGDLRARHSPHLLRVVLEKGPVELVAEAIDEEILERDFRRAWQQARFQVAGANRGRIGGAQVAERCRVELEGIVEESPSIKDPRQPRPNQHDAIVALCIRVT